MSKPPYPTTSNNLSHSFNTQTISQFFRCYSILQGDTTHPSHHQLFRSFQSLPILHFHGTRLTTIHLDDYSFTLPPLSPPPSLISIQRNYSTDILQLQQTVAQHIELP